jgi:hypothetical protein
LQSRSIKIICIKWGNKYSSDYVDKLFRGIQRNTSKEFSFVCYTDNPQNIRENVKIEPIPFYTGDWYSKIGLYNQDLHLLHEQIFYFDLDTVITGNLDDILSYTGDFILLRDFYRKNGYGSGLMSWRPPAVNHMSKNYTRGYKARFGDQGWCEEQYPGADIWQEQYPKKIISYKVHIVDKGKLRNPNYTRHSGSLDTASIICFHGRPNPHEVKEEWIKKYWN